MILSYAALAAVMANLGSIQGNGNFPLMGIDQLTEAFKEVMPGMVCMASGKIAAASGAATKVGRDPGLLLADDTNDVVNADFLKFTPEFVLVLNKTDGTLFFHIKGMAAASFVSVILAGAYVGAAGITLRTNGFTIGTDATINTANDELYYLAIGR